MISEGSNGEGQEEGPVRSPARLVLESLLWVWVLGAMGYFYYSRNFHIWIQQAWEQAVG